MANRERVQPTPRIAICLCIAIAWLAACASPPPHAGSPLAGSSRETQARRLDAALAHYRASREPALQPSDPPAESPASPLSEFAPAGMLVFVYSNIVPVIGLVRAALDFVPVLVLARSEEERSDAIALLRGFGFTSALARGRLTVRVEELDSVWIRDYAPAFARNRGGSLLALDPIYVAAQTPPSSRALDDRAGSTLGQRLQIPTLRPPLLLAGGNFASDGAGRCFTSTAALRANGGQRDFVDAILRDYFGCERVAYLEPLAGPTTKHIDMFFRVVGPGVVLLASYAPSEGSDTPAGRLQNAARSAMERNAQLLRDDAAAHAEPIEIHRIPALPITPLVPEAPASGEAGAALEIRRSAESRRGAGPAGSDDAAVQRFRYPSFVNLVQLSTARGELLLVPSYPDSAGGGEGEALALAALRRAYPRARIVPVDAERLIAKQGALHCATWVIPAGVDLAPVLAGERRASSAGIKAVHADRVSENAKGSGSATPPQAPRAEAGHRGVEGDRTPGGEHWR